MTQVATPETVLGKFDGVELEWSGARYKLDRDADGFYVEMDDPLWRARQRGLEGIALTVPRIKARVGLLTGSHHMQVCWVSPGVGKTQLLVPFAWMNSDKRWVPFDQTFLRDPARPHVMQFWNRNCIGCHSTAPRPAFEPSRGEARTTAGELGIACEACHGPGEAHEEFHRNPVNRYSARLASTHGSRENARMLNPGKVNSKTASAVCGQCHAVKWQPNPAKWNTEGDRFNPGTDPVAFGDTVLPAQAAGHEWVKALPSNPTFLQDRFWKDGMVRVSGREYNGLLESPCYKKGDLSCMSCHSMHNSDPDDQLGPRMRTNDACLQCHTKFRNDIQEHTRHPAASPGSLCYNCHMPFTTYGLLKGIRSHQITSPNIKSARETGRPDACTACHLDKSSAWAAGHLHNWFRHEIPNLSPDERNLSAAAILALKGDAGQRALTAFAMGWEDAQKTSNTSWLAPFLAQLMDDPYPAVRYIAHRSFKTLPQFKGYPFDFTVSPTNRESIYLKLGGASLVTDPQKFDQLLRERDHSSIDLQE